MAEDNKKIESACNHHRERIAQVEEWFKAHEDELPDEVRKGFLVTLEDAKMYNYFVKKGFFSA